MPASTCVPSAVGVPSGVIVAPALARTRRAPCREQCPRRSAAAESGTPSQGWSVGRGAARRAASPIAARAAGRTPRDPPGSRISAISPRASLACSRRPRSRSMSVIIPSVISSVRMREHLHHVVADEVPEVHEVRRVVVHLLERQVPVGAVQLPMMPEVAQRPFDRIPQDGERREVGVEQLPRAEREVSGDQADLIPALRPALQQNRHHQVRGHVPGLAVAVVRVDARLSELPLRPRVQGGSRPSSACGRRRTARALRRG